MQFSNNTGNAPARVQFRTRVRSVPNRLFQNRDSDSTRDQVAPVVIDADPPRKKSFGLENKRCGESRSGWIGSVFSGARLCRAKTSMMTIQKNARLFRLRFFAISTTRWFSAIYVELAENRGTTPEHHPAPAEVHPPGVWW